VASARITSTRNAVVQLVRSLDRPSVRRERGQYLAEGVRLVSEAVSSGQTADLVLFDPDALRRSPAGIALLSRIPAWAAQAREVATHVLAATAQTETPAGVLAVLRAPPPPPPLKTRAGDQFGVILDGISDPGNAGTILRAADAFGVSYVVTTPGTVDLHSPKVVRAGMGAHFRLLLYEHSAWEQVEDDLTGVCLVIADSDSGDPLPSFQWPDRACIVIGSEAFGPSAGARRSSQVRVHIPVKPGVESLNAAVAAAIVLYSGPGLALTQGEQRYR
jgi:TrmH family RNA methyltransferase